MQARYRLRSGPHATSPRDESAQQGDNGRARRCIEKPCIAIVPRCPKSHEPNALRDHDRPAGNPRRPHRAYAAYAVVHWQAIVEPIGRRQASDSGKPMDPGNQPAMADFSRLRQASGSRGENPQGAIVDGHRPHFVGGQRIAALACLAKIDGARLALSAPMNPNFGRLAKRGNSASANIGAFRRSNDAASACRLQSVSDRGGPQVGTK